MAEAVETAMGAAEERVVVAVAERGDAAVEERVNGGGHGKSGDHGKSASAHGQSAGSKAGGGSHRPSKTIRTDDSGSGHKGKGRKSRDTTFAKASKSPKKIRSKCKRSR